MFLPPASGRGTYLQTQQGRTVVEELTDLLDSLSSQRRHEDTELDHLRNMKYNTINISQLQGLEFTTMMM